MNRIESTLKITKRLIIMAGVSLLIFGIITGVSLYGYGKLYVSWMVFTCGLIGGFVSIQQRLSKIGDQELNLLSRSWAQVLLIPIYGGVFAMILYVIFLSEVIQGNLFPKFYIPPAPSKPDGVFMQQILKDTYPLSGQDFAKLIFWSFVAGFSERFVPQVISNIANKSNSQDTEVS